MTETNTEMQDTKHATNFYQLIYKIKFTYCCLSRLKNTYSMAPKSEGQL